MPRHLGQTPVTSEAWTAKNVAPCFCFYGSVIERCLSLLKHSVVSISKLSLNESAGK